MPSLLPLRFDPRLFLALAVAFMGATVVGTVGHECGHWLVATFVDGRAATIHYGSTELVDSVDEDALPGFVAGGPLATMGVGTLGVALLVGRRSRFRPAVALTGGQWAAIFLALHWLREPANLAGWIALRLFGHPSHAEDELRLAVQWRLPEGAVLGAAGLVGAGVLGLVTFRFVPAHQRVTFLAAGLVGGIAGALAWFVWLGPALLP